MTEKGKSGSGGSKGKDDGPPPPPPQLVEGATPGGRGRGVVSSSICVAREATCCAPRFRGGEKGKTGAASKGGSATERGVAESCTCQARSASCADQRKVAVPGRGESRGITVRCILVLRFAGSSLGSTSTGSECRGSPRHNF